MGYNQTNNPFSRKTSPLNEGGYCAKSAGKGGCVTQKDGNWKVISNKTGKLWDANYSSKADAEAALRAYHAGGPSRMSSSPLHAEMMEDDQWTKWCAANPEECQKRKKGTSRKSSSPINYSGLPGVNEDMALVDIEKGYGESDWEAHHGDKKGVSRKASPLNNQGDAEGDPTDENDMYHNSDVYDISFNDRTEPRPNMADLPIGSQERFDEYNRRGWAYDDTTTLDHAMKLAANPVNHMVNSWEEEDVKRGKELKKEGHYSHAEALFDDAHGSYNWHPGMHSHAEHNHGPSRDTSRKERRRSIRADKLRQKAITRSEKTGAERGDEYDYEDPKVMRWLNRANEIDPRTGENVK